jgi:secernin
MCDTLTALARETPRRAALFAKNSDRERNEAQVLEMHPSRKTGGDLKLTYITIPDAPETLPILISRPFWMWGAEMGANSHGVVIGNEALHAKTPAQRKPALTGMDLVRLALERAATAKAAVAVITQLLERYGQGGNCGHLGRFYYQNGFIIADATEAYVLETVRRDWVVEQVKDRRALSNAYSIGADYDAISPGLLAQAPNRANFAVANHFIDEARDAVSFGRGRCARGQDLLTRAGNALTPAAMMAILRDHGEDPDWSPANTTGRTICMHAAQGPRRSQSVASMVSEIAPNRTVHWVTGTSAPCLSLFKPVLFETGLPLHSPVPTDRHDTESLWWSHERQHRLALNDYPTAHALIAAERDALEADFRVRIDAAAPATLTQAVTTCWTDAALAEARWSRALSPARPGNSPYARSWARLNAVAGLPR